MKRNFMFKNFKKKGPDPLPVHFHFQTKLLIENLRLVNKVRLCWAIARHPNYVDRCWLSNELKFPKVQNIRH